ncbi:MAG: hypothetical protein Kow0059_17390 [Candidatus Sumerlaeia bacterium]
MTPSHSATYEDAKRWIAAVLRDSHVREEAVELGLLRSSLDERLMQCVWHELLFRSELRTVSGKPLVIRAPGRWNTSAGPDFLGADLQIAGENSSGDVEIHINSADWRRHRHNEDFAYNGVVLHAFLRLNDGQKFDTLQNGRRIERFDMGAHLYPDLTTIQQTINPDDYYPFAENVTLGVCHRVFATMERRALERFLHQAGRERLGDKVRRFEAQLSGESLEQVFYQAVLASLGHKSSKVLLFLLSKRVPLSEVLGLLTGASAEERSLQAQAILLHVANLVPPPPPADPDSEGFDEDTLEYLNRLHRCWAEAAGYFSDRLIPPTRQWFSGMRPANFPPRRLAGVAELLARRYQGEGLLSELYGLFSGHGASDPDERDVRRFVARVAGELSVPASGYWAHRFTIGGKRAARPQPLIGPDRATSIVFNALIPLVIVRAGHEGDRQTRRFAERVYDLFPPLAENAIVRFMRVRLFGQNWRESVGRFTRECRNQALLKIFQDCCNNNEKSCADCAFFRDSGAAPPTRDAP